jgi:hypothetical protein
MSKPTQLMLDFAEACRDLKNSLERFGLVAEKIAQKATRPEATGQTPARDVAGDMSDLRARVRRLVGFVAAQAGVEFHDAWVLLYREHYLRTGFHAAKESGGRGTHLDAVERAGQLSELHATACAIIEQTAICSKK